jgi:hypothetical protein
MASQYERPAEPEQVSGWAIGGIVFAGAVMILLGAFQILAGLVAIIDDEFYVVRANYTFEFDTTAWGWIHLIVGIVVILVGASLLARRAWAGVATVILAGLSALINFFFIPYYPFWSLLVIALDIWVIWAVTRPGAIRT